MLGAQQLSVAVALPVRVGRQLLEQLTVMFAGQLITGGLLSFTVTVAVQVETLPHTSRTVRITAQFVPMLAQVKVLGVTVIVSGLQLSVLPLSISAGVIVALPLPSRYTVMFLHLATGGVTSFTA